MSPESLELTGRDQMARVLSAGFHPFVVSVFALVLAIYLDGATLAEALLWTVVSFGIVILPLSVFLLVNVRRGRYSDWSISVREQRHNIYALAAVCFLALVLTFIWAGAPAIALACLYAALITLLIAAAINRYLSKISLHSVAMAGSAAVLFLVSPPLGLLLAGATVAVGWARMQLRHHTLRQVLVGWGLAVGSVLLVFSLSL
jgi:membrane-associated phospholipid phosphatase